MKWFNPTPYPLGLTRGSIRAVLALILVIATVAALLASLSSASLGAGAAALVVLTQSVVNDYFKSRTNTTDASNGS